MHDSTTIARNERPSDPLGDVIGRLRDVERRERGLGRRRFAGQAIGGLLAVIAVDLAVDYFGELEPAARRGLLPFCASIWIGLLAWNWRRATVRVRDAAQLAVAAEQHFPRLRGLLRSALAWRRNAFATTRDGDLSADPVSRDLIDETRREAARIARDIDFHELLDPIASARDRRIFGSALAGLLIATMTIASTTIGRTWWERNVLGRVVDWPRTTQLVVDGLQEGRLRMARGGTASVVVNVVRRDGRAATTPEVRLRPRRSHSLVGLGPERNRFRFEAREVYEPFELQFLAGDGRSRWIPVELVDAPRLTQVSLVAWTPNYLGRERVELPAEEGIYRLPRGSRLAFAALCTKRLASAVAITSAGEWPFKFESGDELARDGVRGGSSGGLVDASSTRLFQAFTSSQLGDGLLAIHVTDDDGLALSRPLSLRLEWIEDEPPIVSARWRGAGRWIVPTTKIEWSMEARDDHAVTRAAVLARVQDEKGNEVAAWRRLPPRPELPESAVGRPAVTHAAHLDLSQLDLVPGQTLTLATEAADNDVVAGPKTGRSAERILRVVTPDELRGDWQRRDKEQRQLLEQAWRDWRDLLEEIEGPAATASADSRETARRLRQIRTSAASCLGPLGDVTQEMEASGLESPESPLVERRKTRIMEPLRSLTGASPTPDATPIRADTGSVDTNRVDVISERRALAQLQAVVRELSRVEGFQEAARLLEELTTGQEAVMRETLAAQRLRVRELLERKEQGATRGDDGAK